MPTLFVTDEELTVAYNVSAAIVSRLNIVQLTQRSSLAVGRCCARDSSGSAQCHACVLVLTLAYPFLANADSCPGYQRTETAIDGTQAANPREDALPMPSTSASRSDKRTCSYARFSKTHHPTYNDICSFYKQTILHKKITCGCEGEAGGKYVTEK